ncbi:hypothetical protein AYO42_01575 [Rhizomicrobium sp. SCGC AG-212-E05]|nr:hypothetical protein AYO42_01575 [Rhizomicrobium sp. SCGC AG-212-E05]
MISFEDCVALCGLTAEEIAAIAEHEHVPEIAAAILGQYLLRQENGGRDIQQMIVDDIRAALQCKDAAHAARLVSALHHFHNTHPNCVTASRER